MYGLNIINNVVYYQNYIFLLKTEKVPLPLCHSELNQYLCNRFTFRAQNMGKSPTTSSL